MLRHLRHTSPQHSHIDQHGIGLRLTSQHRRGSPAGSDVLDHESGHFRGPSADTGARDAVVTGKEHDPPRRRLGRECLLDFAQPRRQFFEPPQAAAGFVSESRWFQMSCEPSDVMPSLQNSMPRWGLMPSRNGCLTIVISVTRSAISKSAGLALRPVTTTCSMGRFRVSSATTSARGR